MGRRRRKSDLRALDNPLVAGEAGIQFYLGIPLRTRDGFNLGALCVLDVVPRTPTEADIACLKDLAVLVMEELELQLSARRLLASYHEELARRELREDRIKGFFESSHTVRRIFSRSSRQSRATQHPKLARSAAMPTPCAPVSRD